MVLALATTIGIILISYFLIRVTYETISFYWLTPRRIMKIMEKQGVNGPKPRPLVGNLLEMSSLVSSSTSLDMPFISHDIIPRLFPHVLLWSHKYGKRFIYWNGVEPRMCITEPDMIKELLTKYNSLSGRSWLQQQGSKNFIGYGLLMANGDNWYHQRHIAAPAFTGDKLKKYAEYVVECTEKKVEWMEKKKRSGEKEVEIGEIMKELTVDIISRVEFGNSSEKGKKIFSLLTLLQQLSAQATRHLCLPGSRKYNKEIKALKKEVEELLMEIIESRKGCMEMERSESYGDDLLGILMKEMMMQKKGGEQNFNNNKLQVIMDECKTFFFAGHETTALLLTWTLMLLASNPIWQDKLRNEIAQLCNGANPSIDHLPKLSLLNMIINESLRLYPPATILPRMAFEDIKLGDLVIPKGLSIWIPVLAIHHNEELWGKDVNEFNPQRFASKSFNFGRFFPFGAGPRNCIGQSFAILETKIILAMFVSKFKFTISNNYRHAPVVVLTIKPKHGVQLCLEPLDK